MTYDLIQTFKQIFKDDKVVLDSYKMDAGYYYLAKKDGTLQRLIVNRDNDSDDYELYKYLKVRDFLSSGEYRMQISQCFIRIKNRLI